MGVIPMFVAMLERKTAPGGILASFYSRRYNGVIRKEVKLADISAGDKVLNVGCGGIPYTAMQIASITGAMVWAIDNNAEAANTAKKCIAAAKMEDRITVLHSDGRDKFDFPFDAALVTLQAEPKQEILENLLRQAEPGARIIFRNPRPEFRHQYDSLPPAPMFSSSVGQNKATFDSSVLYRKALTMEGEKHLKSNAREVKAQEAKVQGFSDISLTEKIAANQ